MLGTPFGGSGWLRPLLPWRLVCLKRRAVSLDVPRFVAVVADDVGCGDHGESATCDPPFGALARLRIQEDIAVFQARQVILLYCLISYHLIYCCY